MHVKTLYADIAPEDPVEGTFTYKVPPEYENVVCPGKIVLAPFGSRVTRGCVVRVSQDPPALPKEAIKPLLRILSPDYTVDPELLELASWMSEYYCAPLGECLSCVSFIGFQDIKPKHEKWVLLYTSEATSAAPVRRTEKQQAVVDLLSQHPDGLPLTELCQRLGVTPSVVERLAAKGHVQISSVAIRRKDDYSIPLAHDLPLPLSEYQRSALTAIRNGLSSEENTTFLLHGVTGSGKTEVYLQSIAYVVERGGSAIVLVPEISLTPQTVERFRRRFGALVGVYHSRLTPGQKFDLWHEIKRGECKIVIGARSAVFAPLPNLRVIIVDEEHEPSYKQETSPRYHARDVAIMRAHRIGAVVLLGSATPSIESYWKALNGKFSLLTLPERIDKRPLPEVEIIDLGAEIRESPSSESLVFAEKTLEVMRDALAAGNQVLVFLNRRGFFNFAFCGNCKHTISCKYCDVTLTFHKVGNVLRCHYCGYTMPAPSQCPLCGSEPLSMVGLGTQRVEDELQRLFPEYRIFRIDLDTMLQRTAHVQLWNLIATNQFDILVGTQMIAKGLHLEGITAVVVPLADVSLFQPDFRSAERAFSLLTQVAGRAGRGIVPGRVIIQTYIPYHYAIQYAQSHDYVGFYQKEVRVRKVLRFPPFSRLISILGTGKDEERTESLFRRFTTHLENLAFPHRDSVNLLGPTPAPLARLEGRYRWRALLRGNNAKLMRDIVKQALARFEQEKEHRRIQIAIDVDPQDLL